MEIGAKITIDFPSEVKLDTAGITYTLTGAANGETTSVEGTNRLVIGPVAA